MSEQLGLRFTGHPIIDMGVAAVTVASKANYPEDVSMEQWVQLMEKLRKDYLNGIFIKASGILLTTNAFENTAWKNKPEGRAKVIDSAFEKATGVTEKLDMPCSFFPERKACVKIARDQMPLLHGRGGMNFYPGGGSGIPASELALGCILSIPIASPIVSGRFMIVASDNVDLILDLSDKWYKDLDGEYAKIRVANGELFEKKAARTRLLEELERLFDTQSSHHFSKRNSYEGTVSVALYHLTNSGNNPSITIYTVLPQVNHFLYRTRTAKYSPIWNEFTRAFWISPKGKILNDPPEGGERPVSRNLVLEALVNLPYEAPSFIRRFFLHFVRNRCGISTDRRVSNTNLWSLIHLFLQEIMIMKKEKVEKIKALADDLANEISNNNDKNLYRRLMGLVGGRDAYGGFRQLLIRSLRESIHRGKKPLFTLDEYLFLFEEGEEYPNADWRLIRDLIRIRCLEMLYELKYFAEKAPELLEEKFEDEEETVES